VRVELVDRRVLGAVRYVDATTGVPIRRPLDVDGAGVRALRNLRGLYVLCEAPELARYADSFPSPPLNPAPESLLVTMTVSDPGGRFLPRRHTLLLPRDPNPANAAQHHRLRWTHPQGTRRGRPRADHELR